MPNARYIYLTDQGTVFASKDEPTADDYAFTKVGMLILVRLSDAHYFGRAGAWLPIPAGKLVTPDIEGEESGTFHSLALKIGFAPLPNPQTAPRSKNHSNGWPVRRSSPADARCRRFTSS